MKLTFFLLVLGVMHVSASSLGQTISISSSELNYRQFFKEIRKQTGYDILMHSSNFDLYKKVKVDFTSLPLSEALKWVKERENIDFKVEGKNIIISSLRNSKSNLLIEQQTKTVQGRVTDAMGKALPGVTISIKDSRVATSTNENGMFTLNGVKNGDKIEVKLLGFANQEIVVDNRSDYNVILQVTQTQLTEVVLNTGFQSLNPERVTGSFAYVSESQLEKPTTNIAQRLIGTSAGVQATLDINGNPQFEIRGQSSLYANATPLVVVDGFPIQGDFNTINPNDVESVTILKDAAAASIWGARAANGVIVVVTKKGNKSGDIRVDFQAFKKVGAKFDLDYVNPLASSELTVEYEKMAFNKWSAQENSGAFSSNVGKQWSQAVVLMSEHHLGYITLEERDMGLNALKSLSNKSQIRNNLLANPSSNQINLTISGSSGVMNNLFSIMAEDNQSNFVGTSNKKYLLNYRNTASVLPWLDLSLASTLHLNHSKNNGVTLGDIQSWSPYDMLIKDDGSLTNLPQYYWPLIERNVPMELFPYSDWTYNPIREIQGRDLTTQNMNARVLGGITIKPLKGLTYDAKIQYEYFNTFNRNLYSDDTYLVRNMINTSSKWETATNKITRNLPMGSILDQNRYKDQTWNFRNQLSFNRDLGIDHTINAVIGSEVQSLRSEYFANPRSYGYNDETLTIGTFPNGPGGITGAVLQNWLGSAINYTYVNSFAYTTRKFFSLYGNAAYTYKNKYTLSGSLRTDASNMITDDPAYRYSPFWSIGGAWQVGKEAFMNELEWINRLNARLTYGYNGNVDPTTAFRPLIATAASPNIYSGDYTATISSFGNPTLRWEKTGTWNFGVDYSLFDNKYFGKIDLYRKYGKDLIASLSIPAVNGTTSQKLNNAEMINKGIELEFGTNISIKPKDILWRSSINLSYNHNEITKLFIANYAASSLYAGPTASYVEGYDANSMWMFEYAGIVNTQPMIYGANGDKYDFGAWTPGDGRDFMLNVGTRVAPYTLGFINSFKVYDFDFSFIITGKFGHKFKTLPFNYPPVWGSRVLPNVKLQDVMYGNPEEIVPLPLNDVEPRYYFWDRFHQYLSYLAADAGHIRLQEFSTSYQVPTQRLRYLDKTRISVFLQGNDLFTKVFNEAGEDPEYRLGTMNPRPKFTMGFKMSF